MTPAEATLSLLFKKLHPHLEDAAHALVKGSPKKELLRLHAKLARAREKVSESLDELAHDLPEGDLQETLSTLASDLAPLGETYQQSLILTQLCLEEAPADLLPHLPHLPQASLESSPWAKRMQDFQEKLKDANYQAKARWESVDPEIGDEVEWEE